MCIRECAYSIHEHTLSLSDCSRIEDVSRLGHIHTLTLSRCNNIRDVTALNYVPTLNMRGCKFIADRRSTLGSAHTFDIINC
jgi:hypothetical protein